MEKIQYGQVVTADFSENTITFEMDECFTICAEITFSEIPL